jgi:hypothetical protein
MEREASQDFGTGLLALISRNPDWRADRREPVHVAWVLAPEPQGRRASLLSLVPIVAAVIAELAS